MIMMIREQKQTNKRTHTKPINITINKTTMRIRGENTVYLKKRLAKRYRSNPPSSIHTSIHISKEDRRRTPPTHMYMVRTRIEKFGLAINVASRALRGAAQINQWRIPNGIDEWFVHGRYKGRRRRGVVVGGGGVGHAGWWSVLPCYYGVKDAVAIGTRWRRENENR